MQEFPAQGAEPDEALSDLAQLAQGSQTTVGGGLPSVLEEADAFLASHEASDVASAAHPESQLGISDVEDEIDDPPARPPEDEETVPIGEPPSMDAEHHDNDSATDDDSTSHSQTLPPVRRLMQSHWAPPDDEMPEVLPPTHPQVTTNVPAPVPAMPQQNSPDADEDSTADDLERRPCELPPLPIGRTPLGSSNDLDDISACVSLRSPWPTNMLRSPNDLTSDDDDVMSTSHPDLGQRLTPSGSCAEEADHKGDQLAAARQALALPGCQPPSPEPNLALYSFTRRPSWIAKGSPDPTGQEPFGELVRVANDDLQEAILRGDLGLARRLAAAGASVNAPMRPSGGMEFMCLLHVLASKPELPDCGRAMSEVIMFKANLNVRSSLGATPLARACMCKHAEAVEVLLAAKADVTPVDDFGRTALRWAVAFNAGGRDYPESVCVELIELFARAGVSLDEGGEVSPIVEAVRQLSLPCVLALLEGGATPDGLNDAVATGPLTLISELVKAEANPFLMDDNGKSSMDIALGRGEEEVTTLLRAYIGKLQRNQHPHLKTLEEQRRREAANEVAGTQAISRKPNKNRASNLELGDVDEVEKHPCRSAVQAWARKVNKNRYFQIVMFGCLVAALFLPDMWVVLNIVSADVLDVCLMIILLGFCIEFAVQIAGLWRSYMFTFFFWMDFMGVLSVPLDLSMVVNALPLSFENTVVMRAARMAKLGARAGRFTKLVKLLRFLPGMKDIQTQGTATVMSAILNRALSTRVSGLIITMVMVLPMFELVTYPENDFSLKMWTEEMADLAVIAPEETASALDDFDAFFADKNYFPYEVILSFENGTSQTYSLSRLAPARVQNQVTVKAASGHAEVQFNFQVPHQIDSGCNVALIVTIIVLMIGSSMVLNNSVSRIVLVPLEQLFGNVQSVASKIFHSVATMAGKEEHAEEGEPEDEEALADDPMGAETRLLEKVLAKIAVLSEMAMKSTPLDAAQFAQLGESDRALLSGYGGDGDATEIVTGAAHVDESNVSHIQEIATSRLEEAGLSFGDFESWDLNVADLDLATHHQLCQAILLMEYETLSEQWDTRCDAFLEAVAKAYRRTAGPADAKQALYHNWVHAVDVTLTLSHVLALSGAAHFLNAQERFGLVVAAVCHDLGHWGLDNTFLIATSHELALRYNDHAPLENLHAAMLFELTRDPSMAIFADLEKAQYKEVRHVCIEAILHTSLQCHNPMVKELQTFYDMNHELFDTSEQYWRAGTIEFPSAEVADFARGPDVKKHLRPAFLHLADLSNPMKPWVMAEPWARLQAEELLKQGDVEKDLGLPVHPLHDRDTFNLAYSQLVWIEFFVSPLIFAVSRLIPTLEIAVELLRSNQENWMSEWIEDSAPPRSEQTRLRERIDRLYAKLKKPGQQQSSMASLKSGGAMALSSLRAGPHASMRMNLSSSSNMNSGRGR